MTNSLIRNQQEQVRNLLDSAGSIGIIIGQSQNVDTVAAALSLYLALETYGKNVQIVSQKDPTVGVSNLVGIDRVSKSFDGLTKILTISVPYKEGEIEKVSYNIEGDHLNVNLFAEENGITFSEKDVEYIRKGSSPSLIITVGVTTEDEVKDFVDLKSVKTINIDKNPLNTLMGDISLVDPSFSSVSEIVADLLIGLALPHDIDAYQNLMDGIVYGTRNFTHPTTSAFAFEAAGFLLQNGAKRKQIEPDQQRRDSFPKEELFLNPRPQQNRPNQPAAPSFQPKNTPIPQGDNWPNMPQVKQQNPQPSFVPKNQNNQQPKPHFSAPKEMASELKDMPDEAQFTEGSMGEVPDDWFLPKVFKGSKKGN